MSQPIEEPESRRHRLAVIGSSGGNLRSQGGADPAGMLAEIRRQADAAGIEVAFVQFILADASMDAATPETPARLGSLDASGAFQLGESQPLSEVNEAAAALDAELARLIDGGGVDALMLMSCDPVGANRLAVEAAARAGIPVVGTGGSSMAGVQAAGCRLIAASGTTGTTNRTRAVSAISALAKEWGLAYRPVIGSSAVASRAGEGARAGIGSELRELAGNVSVRGIMMASMPGFIAMALSLALSKVPGLGFLEKDVFNVLVGYLPVLVAAIAAKQVSGMGEVGIVAGVVAGALSTDGGIIDGLAVGIIAGGLVYLVSGFCAMHNVPGTTANIAAGGLSGLAAGLLGKYAFAPVALAAGTAIKGAIDWATAVDPLLAGAVAGLAIWFAIMGGVYHAAILPIIMLEMEKTGFSFLGAIDLTGLVIVCAGIQLAFILRPRNPGDRTASIANIAINLLFGTFVEAAYPYMFSSRRVFAAAIASATAGGALVGLLGVKCTAYVPTFVAPFLSNGEVWQTFAVIIATFALSCALTLAASAWDARAAASKGSNSESAPARA